MRNDSLIQNQGRWRGCPEVWGSMIRYLIIIDTFREYWYDLSWTGTQSKAGGKIQHITEKKSKFFFPGIQNQADTITTFADWHLGQSGSSVVVLNVLPQLPHLYSLSSTSRILISMGPPAEHIPFTSPRRWIHCVYSLSMYSMKRMG
jgi:hypothetical protein